MARADRCPCGGQIIRCETDMVCTACGTVHGKWEEGAAPPGFTEAPAKRRGPDSMRILKYGGYRERDQTSIGIISAACDHLGIPKMHREQAVILVRRARRGGIRAKVPERAAALYIVLQQYGVPRTAKSVCEATDTDDKSMRKAYTLMKYGLDLDIPPPDPARCVPPLCSAVGVDVRVQRRALGLVRSADHSGCDPVAVAAGAVSSAAARSGVPVRQADLSAASRVSNVSIRKHVKRLAA